MPLMDTGFLGSTSQRPGAYLGPYRKYPECWVPSYQLEGKGICGFFLFISTVSIDFLIYKNAVTVHVSLNDVPEFVGQDEQQPARMHGILAQNDRVMAASHRGQPVHLLSLGRKCRNVEHRQPLDFPPDQPPGAAQARVREGTIADPMLIVEHLTDLRRRTSPIS